MTTNDSRKPLFSDVMVDIETLSTKTNSMILSIGAVKFNPRTFDIAEDNTFYRVIDIKSYQKKKHHFDISPDTVVWWVQQSDEARRIFSNETNKVDIKTALQDFSQWFSDSSNTVYIWSHGATFDIPILENAYRTFSLTPPWQFYNVMDTRTIYRLAYEKVTDRDRMNLVYHNSLDDAIAQTRCLVRCMKKIQIQS